MSFIHEYPRKLFVLHVLDSSRWINSSRRLREAAEKLAGDIERFWQLLDKHEPVSISLMVGSEYQNIFLMLYGFAIENLCKAYVVTQLNENDRRQLKNGRLPQRLKGKHNLLRLVEDGIRLELDSDERELLRRLEAAVLWAGRYPVSIGPGPDDTRTYSEHLQSMPQGIRADDIPRTRQLTDRIHSHVAAKLAT
jgi:hypothetical protein